MAIPDPEARRALGLGLMFLGALFLGAGLAAQSYCGSYLNGCLSLIVNPAPLYVVDGLGALVFIVGLFVLIRRYL
jgi:hypothetical protein